MLWRHITGEPRWELTRNPFNELDRIRREMDVLREGLSGGQWREAFAGVFPLMNVTEDKNNYYVRAELPGIPSNELDISVTGDTLSVSGEKVVPSEDENAKYHRRERDAGSFSRVISLPGQVDTDEVEAKSENGILTVTLPKAESTKPKQITVKAN
ncbi:MAG: Hsp20/alpha crystallin family protein [Deltaproteobacteria bacterium]|nr:Hsp20/alpha crystallin family protein [Deltaproteobacteria bacterium]